MGIEVTSRWLDIEVPDNGVGDDALRTLAQDDIEDVRRADGLVFFSEPVGQGGNGGRQVEFGLALAWSKPVIVVGRREHLFHLLPGVTRVDSWDGALAEIADQVLASAGAFAGRLAEREYIRLPRAGVRG